MYNTLYEKWMEDIILKETNLKLTYEALQLYQLLKIRETINKAKNSRFYNEKLGNINSDDIKNFNDFKKLPFTTSNDISKSAYDFLTVSPNEIERVVTLNTSGTTEKPKRIFFTLKDINSTIEFFRYGMLNLVTKGQKVLILMSGGSPCSIGKLLEEALLKAGCHSIIYGPVYDPLDVLKSIKEENIDSIVGIPIQIYYLAKLKNNYEEYRNIKLKSILLSADHISKSLHKTIETSFKCPVFIHYGMTEMGYGGGVSCSATNGYHMREVDLYTEIVDPITGDDVPTGDYGEVVFTTLNREGMPLIRYRTGDIARFLPKKCTCSSAFRRLDYIKERISERYFLDENNYISISMLDEIILGIENVLDYKAVVTKGHRTILSIWVKTVRNDRKTDLSDILDAANKDEYFRKLLEDNKIIIEFFGTIENMDISSGMAKRKIIFEG